MNITIDSQETPVSLAFPCLMHDITDDASSLIVYFIDDSTGIVMSCNNNVYSIGEYIKTWDIDSFVPFTGSITLSND